MSKKSSPSRSSKKRKVKDKPEDPAALPGRPGYRTREGRSGYDPIDTRTEAAHTTGTLIQELFRGRVTKPLYVILLGLLGLVLITPAVLGIFEAVSGTQLPWNAWLFLLITGIAGILILINFIRNLIRLFLR